MTQRPNSIDLNDAILHAPALLRLARALVRDEGAAEDLLQDTWVAALEHGPVKEGRLRSWLTSVLRSKAINRYRGEANREAREVMSARPEAILQSDSARHFEVQSRVLEQVSKLDEPYRTAIYLRFYEDLPPREISNRLAVPLKTVKTRLHRGLGLLRERMDREHAGDRKLWASALIPIVVCAMESGPKAPWILGGFAVKKFSVAVAVVLLVCFSLSFLFAENWGQTQSSTQFQTRALTPVEGSSVGGEASAKMSSSETARTERSAAPESLAVTQSNSGALKVSVSWEAEDSIPGLGVHLQFKRAGLGRQQLRFQRTNELGFAIFDELPAGVVSVWLDRKSFRNKIEITAGEQAHVTLELPIGLTITGRVMSPSGAPVARAEVWMESASWQWPNYQRACFADSQGRFTVRGVSPETRLGARAAGYRPSLVFQAKDFPEAEREVRYADLQLKQKGGRLKGLVLDEMDRPVPGAWVLAGPRGGGYENAPSGLRGIQPRPVRVQTDSTGLFTYPGDLHPGNIPVFVSAPGYPTWSGEVELDYDRESDLEIHLVRGGTVVGQLVDAEHHPVAGGTVVIAKEYDGGWYRHHVPPPSARTDEEGYFRIDGVAPGIHEMNGSPVHREANRGKAKVLIECVTGEEQVVELVLDRGLMIEGRLLDQDNLPVADWRVRSMNQVGEDWLQSYPRTTTTDAQGNFLLTNLGAGKHDLSFSPGTGYSAVAVVVRGVAPGTEDLEVNVERVVEEDATASGTILGLPANANLILRPADNIMGTFVSVDPGTGRFEIGPRRPGSYGLEVRQGSSLLYLGASFLLVAGQHHELETIQVEAFGGIDLEVIGVPGEQLATCYVSAHQPGIASETLRLEGGRFITERLAPGRWLLKTIGQPFFLPDTWVDVVSGEVAVVQLTAEPGRDRRIFCRMIPEDAAWNRLTVELHNAAGELVRLDSALDRRWVPAGDKPLIGMCLPDGEYSIHAFTDTGLEGSGTHHFTGNPDSSTGWTVELR